LTDFPSLPEPERRRREGRTPSLTHWPDREVQIHAQGKTWAEIADLVGNRSAKVPSDTYRHVLTDEHELDYARVIAERLGASTILRRPETMEV
jgi:hypothetical protein